MERVVLGLVFAALCLPTQAQPQWQVDTASVRFEIRNAGLPVHGSFTGFTADLRFDPDDPAHSVIVASIDAATVDTGIGIRNGHLRKRDYFHVDRHPLIRMKSVRIAPNGSGAYNGLFLLDLKGVEREVAVPFTFILHPGGGTFTGSFTINRLDFGIGESSVILSDDVTVHLSVEVSRAGQ